VTHIGDSVEPIFRFSYVSQGRSENFIPNIELCIKRALGIAFSSNTKNKNTLISVTTIAWAAQATSVRSAAIKPTDMSPCSA
jgi:hypothetical protein